MAVTVTRAEVASLIEHCDRGRQSWIDGALADVDGVDVVQDEDMTIFGPFGGGASRGADLVERQERAARLFHGGTGRCEVVKTVVSGDLVVLVMVERNEVVLEGSEAPQRWALRTTQVFEKRPTGWVRLHRHADPLIRFRPAPDTFALARA
jgi:ketosteroid isomerase-like protein